ncbi:hypothetical protein GF406_21515 [candidate division KSB1 bacterium]|nr:hypothetical protein [candidate division KSB1 bacterium]
MTRHKNIKRLLLIVSIFSILTLVGCTGSDWMIDNPYAEVDWTQYQQVKANFHTHTTQSDGRESPAQVIALYDSLDYGALALTDHNRVTWPWQEYEQHLDQLEMIAIQGAEASRHHHMGTFFCNVPGDTSVTGSLAEVRKQNGLAIMFHPGRYDWTVADYVALYRDWSECIGMEIYNQGDRYSGDRETWDQVLTALMPEGRPVWGFSDDDLHNEGHLGRNWTVLLLPERSSGAVRQAMEKGVFFFVYAPERKEGLLPPEIQSIQVDSQEGTIEINATGYDRIEWISQGNSVHQGESIDLSATPDARGYLRAVLYAGDDNTLIGTQPFRIQRQGK